MILALSFSILVKKNEEAQYKNQDYKKYKNANEVHPLNTDSTLTTTIQKIYYFLIYSPVFIYFNSLIILI